MRDMKIDQRIPQHRDTSTSLVCHPRKRPISCLAGRQLRSKQLTQRGCLANHLFTPAVPHLFFPLRRECPGTELLFGQRLAAPVCPPSSFLFFGHLCQTSDGLPATKRFHHTPSQSCEQSKVPRPGKSPDRRLTDVSYMKNGTLFLPSGLIQLASGSFALTSR